MPPIPTSRHSGTTLVQALALLLCAVGCAGAPEGFTLTITTIAPRADCAPQIVSIDVSVDIDNTLGDRAATVRGRKATFDILENELRVALDGDPVTVPAGAAATATFGGSEVVPFDPCEVCTTGGIPNFVAPEIRLAVNGEVFDEPGPPTAVSCQ